MRRGKGTATIAAATTAIAAMGDSLRSRRGVCCAGGLGMSSSGVSV